MAQAADQELTDRFEQFYRNYYRKEIGELAQRYPNEQRSLRLDWNDLYRFDPDLADDYLAQPDQIHDYAREALRLYDLPVDVSLGQAHVRVSGLPEITEIRDIRAHDVNTFVAVQGIVRKATDVRPKIEEAAFECQRCGTLTYIPQSGGAFQEPHECQGCERQGPFAINYDQSTFVDAQKIRVQESPEGLRGGETPQSIDVTIEDDITGRATPGDHVTLTGILRIEQQESRGQKSRLFDVHMDGHALKVEDEEFEEMDIDDEDVQEILELSNSEDIYQLMVDSIAPTIWGFETTKLAIALQLFSGVTKHLPDESRIRGDMHILLIGDPGTGKCVSGDTNVTLADGSEIEIRDLVESHLTDPTPIDDGVYQAVDIPVPSLDHDGSISHKQATKVWKREAPETMYRIRTASGQNVEVTPSHPLFIAEDGRVQARKAENLSREVFIARPKSIPTEPTNILNIGYRPSQANNAVRLELPDRWTPLLARLIGYIIAEGWALLRDDNTADLRITNNDREVIEDVVAGLQSLGLNYTIEPPRSGKSAREIRCGSSEFVSFLEHLEPAILERSASQRVPAALFKTSTEIKAAFLRAYIEAEGTVSSKEREITVGSMSEELLEGVRSLLLSEGIHSQLARRAGGSYRLRISGDDFVQYVSQIGFVTERKRAAAVAFEGTEQNTNRDVIPGVGDRLQHIRESLYLAQTDCGLPRPTYQHYERGDRNPSRESLHRILRAFKARLEWLRETRRRIDNGEWRDIEAIRQELNISQQYLADRMSVTQTAISYYERNQIVPDGGHTFDARQAVLDRIDDALAVSSDIEQLETFYRNDIVWDKITRIEEYEPEDEWVYDLEVADTHNYLSNNIISHNSQLLQYIRHISPRSVYTSGKGSSTAGLTAAAVRDDFGEGQQWSLEAGALVLADKGVAAVDELDKMAPDDRSAMHQALEQQEISISKAGINATLKSRCALLGAANPKYGRFDQYEPIGEQIDLEPALVSRFDLIFTVTDQPDADRDSALADHILQTNYAGELGARHTKLSSPDVTAEEVAESATDVDPAIDPDLFRKYIAYAKRNVFPSMTDEARALIKEFYVDLRARGTEEDAPVPITARKLEALVRLAESSARVRLSDTVESQDAERVIEIVRSCLKDIGVDPETGQFDADVIETGTSKSQRDRIKTLRGLIEELEGEYDRGAPIEEIIDRAEDIGMSESQVEHEIEKLRQRGEIYEPATNHLRTT